MIIKPKIDNTKLTKRIYGYDEELKEKSLMLLKKNHNTLLKQSRDCNNDDN